MAVDLRPYGLNWTLDPATQTTFIPENPQLAKLTWITQNRDFSIELPDGTTKKFIFHPTSTGEGSYGRTYPITDLQDNTIAKAMKIIKNPANKSDTEWFIREVLIQILIVKETESLTNGPFCPRIFYVATSKSGYNYIIMEKMDYTLKYLLGNGGHDSQYCDYIRQISSILKILYEKLNFNHRDLKTDNIMYKSGKSYNGLKLIDFGYSCITYKGLKIFHNTTKMTACNRESRDISSLLYNLQKYNLDWTNNGNILYITNALFKSSYIGDYPPSWSDTYSLLNTHIDSPNMHPSVIFNIFSNPMDATWTQHLVEINAAVINNIAIGPYSHLKKPELVAYLTSDINNISKSKKISADLEYIGLSTTTESATLLNFIMDNRHAQFATTATPTGTDLMSVIIECKALKFFEKFLAHPKLNLADPADAKILLPIAKNISTLDFISPVLALNSTPEFINVKNPNGKSPLQYAIEAANMHVVTKLLHSPGIDLQFTETNALQQAIQAPLPIADTLVSEILQINSTPELINFKNSKGVTALEIAIGRHLYKITQALLVVPNIMLMFSNDTVLTAFLAAATPSYGGDFSLVPIIDKIFELNSTPEFLNAFDNKALKTAIINNNIYAVNKLINSDMVIPQNILTFITKYTNDEVIDTILAKFSAPQYINYVDPTTEKSLLMLIASSIFYFSDTPIYFIRKLLANPQLKTGYRQPSTGKTVLHFLAENTSKWFDGQRGWEFNVKYPHCEFMKLLIDRNPALVEIKDNTDRGPGNPAYVAPNGTIRRYIKSRKSWFALHKNTNMVGGRAKSIRQKHTRVKSMRQKQTSVKVTRKKSRALM